MGIITGQQIALAASGTTQSSAGTVLGAAIRLREAFRGAAILLSVSAASGTGTLDVFIDSSVDGGTTWHNVGHFTQISGSTGTGKQYVMAVNSDSPGTSAVFDVASDCAAGQTRPTGIGDRLRYRAVLAGTGSFTFGITGYAKP